VIVLTNAAMHHMLIDASCFVLIIVHQVQVHFSLDCFFFKIKKIDKKDCDGPHTCKKAARFSRGDGSLMGLGVLFASSTLAFFINDHGPLNLLVHHLYTFVYTVNL
jgi:hypothetical protein